MKIALKIIAGCVWLALVVLFSIYCNGWFSDFVYFFERKVIRAEISPQIQFAIIIIPWNCFISLLLCLPILFVKKQRVNAVIEISNMIVFFVLLLGFNLFGILIWIVLFPESIGDYSGAPTFSVMEPYALNEGWTRLQFWCAWWGFIAASNVFSVGTAFAVWWADKSKQPLILS